MLTRKWKNFFLSPNTQLTEEKVETPMLYYLNRGIKTNARSEYPEIWDSMSIKYILDQTAYAGHTVNFQTAVKSYKTKKQIRLPKEDWIIYRNIIHIKARGNVKRVDS